MSTFFFKTCFCQVQHLPDSISYPCPAWSPAKLLTWSLRIVCSTSQQVHLLHIRRNYLASQSHRKVFCSLDWCCCYTCMLGLSSYTPGWVKSAKLSTAFFQVPTDRCSLSQRSSHLLERRTFPEDNRLTLHLERRSLIATSHHERDRDWALVLSGRG